MSHNTKQTNNTTITDNQMTRNDIVIPGHYCSKGTLKSEVKDIIRIIGPDNDKEGFWITQDGISMHESSILTGYVPLDTKPNNEKNRKDSIMKGFKPIKSKETESVIDNENDYDYNGNSPYSRQIPKHLIPNANNETQQHITENQHEQTSEKFKQLVEKTNELSLLLKKTSVKNLNENYKKKYGVEPYKDKKISITINVDIPYDINKLSQICELFDISLSDVADMIYERIEFPKQLIIEEIVNQISETTLQNNINNQNISTEQETNIKAKTRNTQIHSDNISTEISNDNISNNNDNNNIKSNNIHNVVDTDKHKRNNKKLNDIINNEQISSEDNNSERFNVINSKDIVNEGINEIDDYLNKLFGNK